MTFRSNLDGALCFSTVSASRLHRYSDGDAESQPLHNQAATARSAAIADLPRPRSRRSSAAPIEVRHTQSKCERAKPGRSEARCGNALCRSPDDAWLHSHGSWGTPQSQGGSDAGRKSRASSERWPALPKAIRRPNVAPRSTEMQGGRPVQAQLRRGEASPSELEQKDKQPNPGRRSQSTK